MKTYKNQFLFFVIIFTVSNCTQAQYYLYNEDYYDNNILIEAGVSLGAMNSLTDLAGKKGIGKNFLKDLNLGQTHLTGGVFVNVVYKNAAALRIEGTYGKVSSRDELLKGITDIAKERYNRNLNFKSTIYEALAMVEIHPVFIFINWANRDNSPPRYSPYLLGGVGFFSFNPEGTLPGTNQWVSLQPLHTEGQGFPSQPARPDYKLQQINYPIGLGLKYELSRLFNLRLETVYRILNTDYLDDLSTRYIDPAEFDKYLSPFRASLARAVNDKQINPVANPSTGRKRGNPQKNDGYFTINMKMSIVLGRNRARY